MKEEAIKSLLMQIKHPIEGMAYLIYIGLFIRWKWPKAWNKLLIRMQAKDKGSVNI